MLHFHFISAFRLEERTQYPLLKSVRPFCAAGESIISFVILLLNRIIYFAAVVAWLEEEEEEKLISVRQTNI